ncbi:hypothetical protein G4B88_014850 [Cannabis sativa]|uniref:Uncharacterized protein n=1 Tax=Cannabis sativa TaxID=3483 RepID=A0A7J6I9W5_CANSA|nr:hypothetical protein G4B88_014850 [Cannabis sativa]
MASQTTSLFHLHLLSSNFPKRVPLISSQNSLSHSIFPPQTSSHFDPIPIKLQRFQRLRTKATFNEQGATTPLQVQPNREVEESVKLLKEAAKTRKVPKEEILSAFSVIEKAKIDPSNFLATLGGSESPGRTWMLIFTAEKQLKGGRYFPLTAVQRFDAAVRLKILSPLLLVYACDERLDLYGKRIENGVYLGPIGALTFEGRLSWKTRILAFIFESIRIKIGPLKPLEISLGEKDDREPSNKDPFFVWFYIDEEIAVARGRSGGTAFWCRCSRVTS